MFTKLILNRATLLVSFEDDLPVIPPPVAMHYHLPVHTAPLRTWATQPQLNNPNVPPPQLEDLDGLQLWGRATCDYANRYSLEGDPLRPGDGGVRYSVRNFPALTGYVPHAAIVAGVMGVVNGVPYNGVNTPSIDLDALMVRDWGTLEYWDSPDTIIFSIRNTLPFGGNWHGSEIVVLPNAGPPFCLVHGGHIYNNVFPVGICYGLVDSFPEIDAIDAYPYPYPSTPTLTEWGLIILVALLIGSTVFILLRRRKVAVPS